MAEAGAAGQGATDRRYRPTAQWLHWLTALLILVTLPIAWQMPGIPQHTPARELYFTAHKSIGIIILLLSLVRVGWRAGHPAPPFAPGMPRWAARLARANHLLLYVLLLAMPITGYVHAATGPHPGSFLGLVALPTLPRDDAFSQALLDVHLAGQWLLYVVVAIHVLAVAWHVVVRRDGALERMLPSQTRAS